jgi:hypothetical protein
MTPLTFGFFILPGYSRTWIVHNWLDTLVTTAQRQPTEFGPASVWAFDQYLPRDFYGVGNALILVLRIEVEEGT